MNRRLNSSELVENEFTLCSMLRHSSRFFVLFLFLVIPMLSHEQQASDELKVQFIKQSGDTASLSIALQIAKSYKLSNPDSLIKYSKWIIEELGQHPPQQMFKILGEAYYDYAVGLDMKSEFDKAIEASTLSMQFYQQGNDALGKNGAQVLKAWILYNKGDVVEGLDMAELALNAAIENEDQWKASPRYNKILGNIYSDLGTYYKRVGESDKAVEFSEKSLSIRKKLGDKNDLAEAIMNLGRIFHDLQNFEEALKKYNESLALVEETKNTSASSFIYSNRGQLYYDTKRWDLAEMDFRKSLELRIKLGDNKGKANILRKLGEMFLEKGDYALAKENFQASEKEYRAIQYKVGLSQTLLGEGKLSLLQSDTTMAFQFAEEAYLLSKNSKSIKVLLRAAEFIQPLYKHYGKLAEALTAAEEIQKAQSQIKQEEAKEMLLKQAYMEKQASSKRYIYYLIAGAVVLLVILFLVIRAYRLKKRTSALIEKEKMHIEERNKNMVDSIQYAQQLQQAILPPRENIKKAFADSFLIYWPKDIVAGDFYWLYEDEQYKIWSVADCTGHGVPGAMVSVVCSNAINRVVKEQGLREPGEILNQVRKLVIETFKESNREVKDGMDMGLCVYHKVADKYTFAGANRPVWIAKPNAELKEVKGDKQHIGFQSDMLSFETKQLGVEKGDVIYLMTDGFVDQFGGPNGKKYMSSRLKSKLVSISNQPCDLQQLNLEWEFNQWKGESEQIDDVCILAIKCG